MTNETLVHEYQVTGDMGLLADIYEQNKGLICRAAYKFLPTEQEDAAQMAFFAVLASAERYTEEAGCSFSSYLWQWLRAILLRYRRNGMMLDPGGMQPISLDTPVDEGNDLSVTLVDILPGGEATDAEALDSVERVKLNTVLRQWLSSFGNGGDCICMRFLDGLDDKTISARTGQPVEIIKSLEQKTMKKLRNPKEQRAIVPFLPEEYQSAAYRGSLKEFKITGCSATERTAFRLVGEDLTGSGAD